MNAPTAIPDVRALRACWHPVAFAESIGSDPVGLELLDEPLVAWRDGAGVPHVLSDICIHRGTALSLGRIEDGEIVCAYHGWRYAATGVCTRIPQLVDPTRIPAKARVASFACKERYGMLWVALEDARWPLPEVAELEDPASNLVAAGPYSWKSDASRQLENFTDFGHFPWVHPGLLGDPSRPVVPEHTVETDGHILRYRIVRPEAPPNDDFPVFGNEVRVEPERRSLYELHLPYTIVLRINWGGERQMVYFFASQPISSDRCSGYVMMARNYDHDQPPAVLQKFEDTIFNQDQRVVESQRPEQVPFDLADELHLKFDAVAVAYRRAMRAQGLATSAPATEIAAAGPP